MGFSENGMKQPVGTLWHARANADGQTAGYIRSRWEQDMA